MKLDRTIVSIGLVMFLALAQIAAIAQWQSPLQQSPTIQANITGGTGRGQCTFEVAIEGAANVELRGSEGRLEWVSGGGVSWRRLDCNQSLPRNPNSFQFRGIDGRGTQTLLKDPNQNNGIAVIRLDDPQNGSARYIGEITWDGGSNSIENLNTGGNWSDLQILQAEYGVGNQFSDVTVRLNSQIQNGRLRMQVSNDTMGGDPAFGKVKTLTVQYAYGGQRSQAVVKEGDILILPGASSGSMPQSLRCESNDGRRNYCPVDTRGGVRLSRQISGSACTQGSTWGYDSNQIWVDRGCRAEFEVMSLTYPTTTSTVQSVRCESNDGRRNYCPADTRGGVRLSRQISGSPCSQDSTWGYDSSQIWVDRGCRADFEIIPLSYTTAVQTVRCESNDGGRNYCPVDTRGGVRLSRQVSGSACSQGSTWGYDSNRIWVDRGCRADFEVMPLTYPTTTSTVQSVRCESNDGRRNYCPADTRGGVRLSRQVSDATCTQGSTWGYDSSQIWVDRGCRAEFEVMPLTYPTTTSTMQSVRCESNDGRRNYCPADTRGGVRLSRQVSDATCTEGSTWGYDSNQIWVDRGCRADFEVASLFGTPPNTAVTYLTIPSGTELAIRTNEAIDSAKSKVGQQFSGVMNADVMDDSRRTAIPKGSDVQLVIRSTAGSDLVLDIDSVVVAGQRFVISTKDLSQKGREGIGANRRTVEMVGGGAAVGALIGAIAGGAKGAAIGAAVGAAGGAGVQVMTKGKEVKVPAETVLTFRLDQDLTLQTLR